MNTKTTTHGSCLAEPSAPGAIPWVRTRDGVEPLEWGDAAWLFANRFKSIMAEHGPESVAFLSSGRLTLEETALLGALAKFGMGMLHGAGNERLDAASAGAAYENAFGFDAPPFAYQDLEASDTLVFAGVDPAAGCPAIWNRVQSNPHAPKIITLDPRATKTARGSTHHYALKPKSDVALLRAVARRLAENGWVDQKFIDANTEGYAAFRAHVATYPTERSAARCGLKVEEIEQLARLIHEGERVSFWWGVGVDQHPEHGARTAAALINLALMTGSVGRDGTGANSIAGRCGALGARLFGNTTKLLAGHDFSDPRQRRKIAALLNISERRIPDRPSPSRREILQRVKEGKIKALWMVGALSSCSHDEASELNEALDQLEFLVAQDSDPDDAVARGADLYLPAAAFSEKEGVLINSERRLVHVAPTDELPGKALSDFAIFHKLGAAWQCGRWIERWDSPARVFSILKKVSAGQPCDITGIRDHTSLDAAGGARWPCPAGREKEGDPDRLFEDGRFFHENGKARFVF